MFIDGFIILVRSSRGKSEGFDLFSLGRDFAIRTVSMERVISCILFVFESRQIQNMLGLSAIYNKLLTNLARSSRTGQYWPSVVFLYGPCCDQSACCARSVLACRPLFPRTAFALR